MKTDRELMQEFVEMMRYESGADKEELQNADRMNESYCNGVVDADEFITNHETFKAMENRLKYSSKMGQTRAIYHANGSDVNQKRPWSNTH